MLSQQLVTKPVFDALFEHYQFTENNSVSKSMQNVLKVIESGSLKEDAATLKAFYDSVRMRVRNINNAEARQKVIKELYDRFFNVAFKKMSDRLGIVYTPIEVVDFIIQSVEEVMKSEFGTSLSDKDVHILDPFTGTGTFIVRLLQSGIIKPADLQRKFKTELHANEIVLLAYYIASVNIEETYHEIAGGTDYVPFNGGVLTDTFQLNEEPMQGSFESALPENSKNVEAQKKLKISVIISNPPYSAGQGDANENNQNLDYPALDKRIENTYAKESTATNKNSLYDSYIRGIRWATDRISDDGIVGFVTNGSFIDSNSADGLRKTIAKEFSKIYCFNLRGNQRTSGELSRKEGGKIFGSGSRTPVAITILVKNSKHKGPAEILYHDIGDYLSQAEKLKIISDFKSVSAVPWKQVQPNPEGDWINLRNPEFDGFLPIGDKSDANLDSAFETYSRGVSTSRDAWCYNFSIKSLKENVNRMITFYNSEVRRLSKEQSRHRKDFKLDDFINSDERKISWNRGLKNDLEKLKIFNFDDGSLRMGIYRPFTKSKLYFNKSFNDMTYQIPRLYPTEDHENLVIAVTGNGVTKAFSNLISDVIPDIQLLANGQCFPLYHYEHKDDIDTPDLLKSKEKPDKHGYIKREALTDFALEKFQESYSDKKISKEDIFYYIYGILHSPTYKEKYQNDLKKMLPRIPFAKDFWGYSNAGRELAKWHLNYETIKPYPLKEVVKDGAPKKASDLYKVNEAGMKFPKDKKVEDRTQIIFNSHVTLSGIPLEAYDYVVNGKSALEWVMERYAVTVDLNAKGEGSGIKNDPNEWSDDPRYIIDLVKRVVQVSLETNKIVKGLPKFELLP